MSGSSRNRFQTEEYIVEMLVPTENNATLKTIQELQLDKLDYGQLVSIVRFDHFVISPVKPDEPIFGGDRLVFSGHIEPLLELRDSMGFVLCQRFQSQRHHQIRITPVHNYVCHHYFGHQILLSFLLKKTIIYPTRWQLFSQKTST